MSRLAMPSLHRRAFALGCALAAFPCAVFAASRLTFMGSTEQGGLVVGRAEPGARVTLDGRTLRVSAAGDFVFGFAYNQKEVSRLVARYADGTTETHHIAPGQRHYNVQRINGLPQEQVTPAPAILARIKHESAVIAKTYRRDTAFDGYAQGFDWPVPGVISSVFGSQRILNGTAMAPHLGVDIAAPQGTPIRAPADAIVALVGDFYLDGGTTILDHGHGVTTVYIHQVDIRVKKDDRVKQGDVIGKVGATGRATGPNLHWGMGWFAVKLDPSLATPTPTPPAGQGG